MDIATLGLEIRSDGVVVATDRLKKFGENAGQAERSADGLSRAFRALGPLIGAVAAAFSVRALVQYADAWSDMSSRIGAAIKDMDAAPAMMKRMVEMANASYSPLEQTVEVYSRNVAVLKDLGVNAAGAADFTESLNHMLVITATRGERAASVQNALSKAMAVGKLSGDGLETVLANGGRVAEALAAELGTTVSGLRGVASQGKITGDVIARALISPLEQVRAEAAEMPATIGDAFTRINNNTTALIGTLDKAWGTSSHVAEAMLRMADSILASTDAFLRIGTIVGSIVGPAFDMLASSISSVGEIGAIVGAGLLGYFAGPALIAGVWGLAQALTVGVVGALRAVAIAMMANPLGLLIAGLAAALTAAFIFRDKIKEAIGVDVVDVMKSAANLTIGAFVGGFNAVKDTWMALPMAMSDITMQAAQGTLNGVVEMINSVRTEIVKFLQWASPALSALPGGSSISMLAQGMLGAPVKAPTLPNPNAGAADYVAGKVGSAMTDAMGTDYIGNMATAVGELWTNAEGAGGAIAALINDPAGAGVGSGSGAGKTKENPYDKLVRGAHEFVASQQLEAQALGMTAEAANRMRYEQDMLNQAANDNIKLTPKMREEIGGLAQAMAAAEEATRRLTEIYSFGKDVFTGFFGDLKSGISEGKSLWESLGNAATNALDKIADKALSMAANGIFDMIFGAVMGGLTGGMGNSLGGGWGVAGGFGKPGIFGIPGFADGTNYAPGGMAWVGERGPELVNLPRGAQVIPNGPSMALAANGNGSNDNRRGDVHIQINGSGLSQAEMQAAIADALDYYDRKTLPSRVNDLKNDSLVVNG